jgi:hypothetical protein
VMEEKKAEEEQMTLDNTQRVKNRDVSGEDESGVEEGSESEDIDEKRLSQLELEDAENRKQRRQSSSPFVDGTSLTVRANCR